MHALILGGEMFNQPYYVERGLYRLRQAIDHFSSCGFPGEFCSTTYTPVSLQPLAYIAEHAQNPEARDLALRLERFFWRDLAVHYDPRSGAVTGPISRSYIGDTDGFLNGIQTLVLYLFPERFSVDITEEFYVKREKTDTLAGHTIAELPFWLSHPVWYASANYHFTRDLEETLFEKKAGAYVGGQRNLP